MVSKQKSICVLLLVLCATALVGLSDAATVSAEKPIIVCTTAVLGSIVKEMVGNQADVVVLVNPSLCPAFYDVTPGDIYALSKAKLLFHHGIPGEMWLKDIIKNSEASALVVKVSEDWNTPEDAKKCVSVIAENLSRVLGMGVKDKANKITDNINVVVAEIKSGAEALNVAGTKVVCMSWLKRFVEFLGFKVIAEYGPPQEVSVGKVAEITLKAKEEKAMLVIDNLQSGTDLGAKIASEVGATHVVLTNFPGAVLGTETIAKMLGYNAEQLFNGVKDHARIQSFSSEIQALHNRVIALEATSIILAIVAGVEAIAFYAKRKARR